MNRKNASNKNRPKWRTAEKGQLMKTICSEWFSRQCLYCQWCGCTWRCIVVCLLPAYHLKHTKKNRYDFLISTTRKGEEIARKYSTHTYILPDRFALKFLISIQGITFLFLNTFTHISNKVVRGSSNAFLSLLLLDTVARSWTF